MDAVSRAIELHCFPNGLVQFAQRHHAPVQGQDLVDLQLELFDVVVQIHTKRIGLCWLWGIGRLPAYRRRLPPGTSPSGGTP